MNTRVALKIWAFWVGLTLWPLYLPNVTAQQAAEPPAGEVVPPTGDNANEIPPDETADSTMEENSASVDQVVPDEPEPLSPAEEAFQRALEHERNNELEDAIADCTEAIRLDPGNLQYLISRAQLYLESQKYDKALEDSAKVVDADPSNLRAHLLSGKAYELSGETEKALTEFNTAVERNPTNVEALLERQNHFVRQGQNEKAMADADRIIQLEPDSPAGFASKAMIQEGSGQPDQAMSYSAALIQAHPENWIGYKMRGSARVSKGDFVGAMEDFETALKLSPENGFIYSSRALLYDRTGEYDKGVADLQKAAELQPDNYAVKANLADILATCPDDRIRDGKKASEYAAEALKFAPNDPFVWEAYASAAAENGNYEEASKWQQRVLASKAVPSAIRRESEARLKSYKSAKPYRYDFVAMQREATASRKINDAIDAITNGNFDRAIALSSEVIGADNKNAKAYYTRGLAHLNRDEFDLAISDCSEAIKLNPNHANSYSARGNAFFKKQDYQKAVADLRNAVRLSPAFPGFWLNLGRYLEKQREYAQAVTAFLKVHELDSNQSSADNELAWLLSTSPDENVRNAGEASEYVDAALTLNPDNANIWDTCAAVFAENGDFEDAIEWEKAFLDRTELSQDVRKGGEERLALYQRHQPYREQADKPVQSGQLTASTTPKQPEK